MDFSGISGFGSMLASFIDTGVSSSDRRAANELNYYATMDTNKTNADINESQLVAARENWAREQQNFETQRQWALADRRHEEEYNSPEAVRQRYLQAGINPALAMANGAGGSGSAAISTKQAQAPQFGSPPSSIPMQAAHFDPTYQDGIGLGMQRAIDTYLMAMRNETDIAAIRQDTANKTAETAAKIRSMGYQDEYNKWLAKKLEQDWKFNDDNYEENCRNIRVANDKLAADAAYTKSQTEAQVFANSIAPEIHDWNRNLYAQELAKGQAMIAELYSRRDLNEEQKELVSKKISEQVILNSNLPKSLHNDNAIKVATYNQIKQSGLKLQQETKNLDVLQLYQFHFSWPSNKYQ